MLTAHGVRRGPPAVWQGLRSLGPTICDRLRSSTIVELSFSVVVLRVVVFFVTSMETFGSLLFLFIVFWKPFGRPTKNPPGARELLEGSTIDTSAKKKCW